MFKKIIYSILIVQILLTHTSIVIANDDNEDMSLYEIQEVVNQVDDNEPKINSKIAVIYDRNSGKVIWGKNENKKTAMASTTKILTAIIAIENCELTKVVEISPKAAGTGGSRLGLKTNDKITMNDLLYGLLLVSGNDAAVAIAECVGGSVEEFSNLMNEKSKQLGLQNSHFVTPHGLDHSEHYTTAYELAKIADYALRNATFAKIVGTKTHTITINGSAKSLSNTNELLGYLNGVTGVKTGFTNNAGRCLVTSVNRDGFEIITVVLQSDTKKIRTKDSISLIEYAYKNFEPVNIKEILDRKFNEWCLINQNRIQINKCKNNNLNLYITELQNNIIPVKKKDIDNIEIEVNNLFYLEAPIQKDTIIGSIKINLNGENIDAVEIRNNNCIEKKNIWDYFNMFALELVR